MKVPTPDALFYYPDVVVACSPEPEDQYLEDAPCLIVEVISPRTESTDRREKLIAYRKISSLREYLIVEQDEARVERHFRDGNGRWHSELVEEGAVPIPCPPNAKLSITGIYAGL